MDEVNFTIKYFCTFGIDLSRKKIKLLKKKEESELLTAKGKLDSYVQKQSWYKYKKKVKIK